MKRRFVLAMMLLGALSATAHAQSQSVVTLPLKPPPAKSDGKATKPAPKPPAAQTETIASAPTRQSEPLSPQAVIEIPPPAFSTEPLFPAGLAIDTDALPTPAVERALIEAEEKRAAQPPMPRPKPDAPTVVKETESAPPLSAAMPAAPTATALTKETASAATTEKRPLRRGEMEPIDDYRPPSVVIDSKALERSLVPGSEKPAKTATPQPKPAPEPKADKKAEPRSDMMPIDDIPGGKSYKAPPGKATTFRCFVRDVMAFYDRTHIRCYNKAGNKLNFFAVDTSQPISEALVAKGLAAMKSGKPATVTFAPGPDLNPSNCAPANCRRLIDIQN